MEIVEIAFESITSLQHIEIYQHKTWLNFKLQLL